MLALLKKYILLICFQSQLAATGPPADEVVGRSLEDKWSHDFGFSGISTFGRLPHIRCLLEPETPIDIGIIGVPFDSGASYRPGARFGPRAIRAASSRHLFGRGFNAHASVNPYQSWATLIDCGDIPVTPFDKKLALQQMTEAFTELGDMPVAHPTRGVFDTLRGDSKQLPRFITLGGDHLVALPALRALRQTYGQPITLLHFDAHLDTLLPSTFPTAWSSEETTFNHGTVFLKAFEEGLLDNRTSVHAGINTRLSGVTFNDYIEDDRQGFVRIHAEEMDEIGHAGIAKQIIDRIGIEAPVYLSLDIDVLDPAFAPGTGAPEPGGWSTREMIRLLRGLRGLNIIGADVVEVAPAYDTPGQDTAFVAACLVYEIMTNIVVQGVQNLPEQPILRKQDNTEAQKTEL